MLLNSGVPSFGSLHAPLSLAALQGCDFHAQGPTVPPALSNKLNRLSSLIPLGERFFQSSAHLCLPAFCRAFALFLLPSGGIFFSPYSTPLCSPRRWHYSNPHKNSNKKQMRLARHIITSGSPELRIFWGLHSLRGSSEQQGAPELCLTWAHLPSKETSAPQLAGSCRQCHLAPPASRGAPGVTMTWQSMAMISQAAWLINMLSRLLPACLSCSL